MGNKSSVVKEVSATLEMISSTVVSSNKSCLATAANKILISIGKADNVTIRDVTITQVADAELECVQESTIQIGNTVGNVEAALDKIIVEATASGASLDAFGSRLFRAVKAETTTKVTNRIAHALNAQMVSQCLAESVNSFTIRAKEVHGDVNIINLSIEQVAHAQVKTCMQSDNIKVGEMPMVEYITAKFNDGTIGLRPGWEGHMPPSYEKTNQQDDMVKKAAMAAGGIALVATAAAGISVAALRKR